MPPGGMPANFAKNDWTYEKDEMDGGTAAAGGVYRV